jgi:hypothetical protein
MMDLEFGHATAVLERTPAILDAWLRGMPEPWTRGDEGPGTWSPFDVVGHLIDGEETDWIPRAQIILGDAAERRFLPFDRFRHLTRNQGRTLDSLLDEFAGLRQQNVAILRTLPMDVATLNRTGVHPEFGAVTLAQLLATWVAHDLNHLGQIARVMARHYQEAVGPWRAYLGVLNWRS